MNLDDIKKKAKSKEQFEKLQRRTWKNKELSKFYTYLAEEHLEVYYDRMDQERGKIEPNRTYMNTAKNVALCAKWWKIDYYKLQGVKDMKYGNLCHNRFCDNCQNEIAKQRAKKYEPVLDRLAEDFDLYHLVFTVPNPLKRCLCGCLDVMYKNIKYMFRLLSGNVKIDGYNFEQFGYWGAVRALEITESKNEREFHPHFHCIVLFRKGLRLDENRTHVNVYSFDREHVKKGWTKQDGTLVNKFSDLEILLQKIWRLRIDGIEVNADNIERLPLGYSVMCRKADNYKEVFKYATKGCLKHSPDEKNMDDGERNKRFLSRLNDFEILEKALKHRKVVQGYGKLYHWKFADVVDQSIDFANDQYYLEAIKLLHKVENPDEVLECFDDMMETMKNSKKNNISYISCSSVCSMFGNDGDDWELI